MKLGDEREGMFSRFCWVRLELGKVGCTRLACKEVEIREIGLLLSELNYCERE